MTADLPPSLPASADDALPLPWSCSEGKVRLLGFLGWNNLGFPAGSLVKKPPAMQETQVRSLNLEDPLKEEMATQSSILAWEIPWTEEPGGLQSMALQRVRHNQGAEHARTESKTRLKDGRRTKRWELVSGRENGAWSLDEVGEAAESRGQARGPQHGQVGNALTGKTKWFCSRGRGERSGNTWDWRTDPWPFTDSPLWFCDSFSCSPGSWREKREPRRGPRIEEGERGREGEREGDWMCLRLWGFSDKAIIKMPTSSCLADLHIPCCAL